MVKYSDLVGTVYRLLDDEDQTDPRDELIYDALVAAHSAILPYIANVKVYVSSGSDVNNIPIPSDCYDVQAIQLADGSFISKATLSPGTARGSTESLNDWIESPRGYINLSKDLTGGDSITVHYLAYFEVPSNASDNDFVIKVPRCAHMGMIYYALSVIIEPIAVSTAKLGPFRTRIDSGTPIHNPMELLSHDFLKKFYTEMKQQPSWARVRS